MLHVPPTTRLILSFIIMKLILMFKYNKTKSALKPTYFSMEYKISETSIRTT